jgi:predicted RNA methylase
MEKMSDFWSMNEGTFYCLYDKKRTLAFKKAILNTVKKGDVVLELGAGSGVLSMFAADAGARKVYAIELDVANIHSLKSSVKSNGYDKQIEVLHADATTIDLPEKVDVIICEMIATGLVEELQIPAMNNALRFAKKTTKVLLKEYNIALDLVNEKNTFYNKQFDVIRYEFPDLKDLKSKPLSERKIIRSIDFSKPVRKTLLKEKGQFTITENGIINGLRLSADTVFSDNSTFDYSISYSFPAILPIDPIEVKRGDICEFSISYSMCEGPHRLKYSIKKTN